MKRRNNIRISDSKQDILYWKSRLEDFSVFNGLPRDFTGLANQQGLIEKISFSIPSGMSARLLEFSNSSGVSLFTVFLTTIEILLHKYSGDNDLNIVVSSGSYSADYKGPAIIRMKFVPEITFKDCIKSSGKILSDTFRHGKIPFGSILDIINPVRDENKLTAFHAVLVCDHGCSEPEKEIGTDTINHNLVDGRLVYDISFSMLERKGDLEIVIMYNSYLFNKETIKRLIVNYINLVWNLITGCDQPISSVPWITEEEKLKVLGFTETDTQYPSDKTITQLFEEQVELFPGKTAVVYGEKSLTYDQLNKRSNQLAEKLLEIGLEKSKPVGILADKSIEMITGILGILKAGGVYLPIDPEYPAERIKFMVGDTGCRIFLTQLKYINLPIEGVTLIFLDLPAMYQGDDQNVVNKALPEDPAYLMYTSGTTGMPKGSLIRHKSVIRLVRNTNYITLTSEDRILMTGAIVFDAATFEIWGALLNGGSLYIIDKEDILDSKILGDALFKYEVTTLWLTSSLFTHIVEYRTDIFSKLKYLLVGGDVLSPPHINKVRKNNPGLTVINGYGPTENTTFTTCYHIEKDFEYNIPIGKPISNTSVYIFDKYLHLQPVGVTGELYAGGEGLSLGYLNREDLNKISFIDNPYKPGERLYKTGDYGRWLPDGTIEFRGRMDNQVKIRGFRVETGEIESIISGIEGVIGSVVKAVRLEDNDARLVAFLDVNDRFTKEPAEISGLLRSWLPEYMVPVVIKTMHGFPLTINGKIDRDALKYDLGEIKEDQKRTDIILTPTEEKVYKIWCEVLKTEDLLPTGDFFEMGGNSLLGISVINRLEEQFNVRIRFKDLKLYPTIYSLSTFLAGKALKNEMQVKLVHRNDLTDLPLTNSQTGLWLLNMLNPGNPDYILSFIYKLSGSLNLDLFKRSIEILFQRHIVLFSRFYEKDGKALCKIVPEKVNIQFINAEGASSAEKESRVMEFISNESRRRMDFKDGPLYRLFLINLSGEEYIFYFVVHHIIFDGWSWRIFVNDLDKIYSDLLDNNAVSFNPPEYQISDFADWENRSDIYHNKSRLVEYWRNRLDGCSGILNFPYDHQRPAISTGFGDRELIQFSPELSSQLRRISKQENVSLFSVMLATFGILMHKYSGDPDLNIGTPVANRNLSSMESIIGMFVNTLPIRIRFDEDCSFKSLLELLNVDIIDAIEHGGLPFERIVELNNPERFANINPIFQVAFAWGDELEVPIKLRGIQSHKVLLCGGGAAFDITCGMSDNGKEIGGEIEYNIELIDRDTIIRLRDNYINLIKNLVGGFDKPIASIPFITDEERKRVLDFTATASPYPSDKTIARLFEEQVKINPEKTAIVFGEVSLTYDQLNRRSNQVAWRLYNAGIKPDNPVGILADKSIELVTGILGIIKSGGAYLPLDPEYPADRISFMIQDARSEAILIQQKYADLSLKGVTKISLDSSSSLNADDQNFVFEGNSSDLAYIMYTSGTTGRPKGSMIRHKSVARLVRNTNYIEITPNDRILFAGAMVFDVSTFEIWGALLNGGTLYIIDKNEILDPALLGNALTKNKISILLLTSALFNRITEYRADLFKELRYLFIGGDVLSPQNINKVIKANPQLTIINGYGPTENTTNTTCYKITKEHYTNIPIGKPVSNTTVYIFDKYLNLQPIGVIGELYTGGDGLSMGYLNRDELNDFSFINHPLVHGEKLFRTGDYCRWLPDGNIEFHGRKDNQLKIRGFRVEPEEIEAILSGLEGVIEAVVKAFRITKDDIRLVAYLHVNKEFNKVQGEIEGILRSKIPTYMIPSAIRIMHEFPLTINGKVDRNALKYVAGEIKDDYDQEAIILTPTEEKIYKIWSDVLKSPRILPTDNFFEIGGNSLLAISVVNRLGEILNVDIQFKDLILYRTIVTLGSYLDSKPWKNDSATLLSHRTSLTDLPLTQSQTGIWVLNKINPSSPAYIIPFAYRLTGYLDPEIFERSIEVLFNRHHVLFSTFYEKDGKVYCKIEPQKVCINKVDINEDSFENREDRILGFINKDSRETMDLNIGPLFRLYLFKSSPDVYYFYFAVHHIVFDGWSWRVFVKDLSQTYNDLKSGRHVSLEEIEYQQYDFADWESGHILLKSNELSNKFWKDRLEGCSSVLNFPYDIPRLRTLMGYGEREYLRFSPDLSSGLRLIAKQEGVSLFSVLLTSFGILMHKYSGDSDLNIGTPVANRSMSGVESIVGMFVNMLAIRFQFDDLITFRELLRNTNGFILDAIEHQNLPFERIVQIVNPERKANLNPLFQTAFTWDENLDTPFGIAGVKSDKVWVNGGTAIFDLTCALTDNGKEIEGEIEFNIELIRRETILRLIDNYFNLLKNLMAGYEKPISSISLVTDAEKEKILEFNNTYTPYPSDKTIVQLFEDQAGLYPQKTAVVFKGDILTYKQLNEKANQLAWTLLESGVRGNSPVGILAEKSLESIIGILGILKAGGAYVPLDPDYPGVRKDFIIQDSGCRFVLMQGKYFNITFKNNAIKLNLSSPDLFHKNKVAVEGISTSSSDMAYIMYTSGTTGEPKGSMINHYSITRLVRNTNYIKITGEDRILLTSAIVFDVATFEIWGALLNGASLYLAEKATILDPEALGEELKKHEITILWLTSALFTHIAESRVDIFGKLKYLLVGGDVVPPRHINKVKRANPDLKVINGYGPTENTTFSTAYLIEKEFEFNIPIGKPVSNSTAYIFDKNMNYQPIGIVGELYVGGDGLSTGYINRNDLNKKSFISHPYLPNTRIYRTGDYARWLPDGNIEFHGRLDNQLKVRGFRVELGEIESIISKMEGVIEAVVKPVKMQDDDIRLIAFLNVSEDYHIDIADLKRQVKEELPSYMIPSAYRLMNGFPKTINGKTDRKALTFEKNEEDNLKSKVIHELTQTERTIYNIWAEALKTNEFSVTDNFFDAGGNSLLAVSVFSRIETAFNVELGLRVFFDSPRIKDIAEAIEICQVKTNEQPPSGRIDPDSELLSGEI